MKSVWVCTFSEVRVGMFVSSSMVGICSPFDGCSHFLRSGKEKKRKKEGCLFSDVGFQAEKFHERCSLQAARRGWQTARLSSPIRSCFSRKMWERGCADRLCLYWEAHLQEIGIFHIKQSSKRYAFSVLLGKQEHQVF